MYFLLVAAIDTTCWRAAADGQPGGTSAVECHLPTYG